MRDTRTYRGMSPQERLTERRNRLLAAAFQQFGAKGYPATTIDALCADAHVSTRGFYECFSSREAMLAAVHEQITTEAMPAVRLPPPTPDHAATRAGAGAFQRVGPKGSPPPRDRRALRRPPRPPRGFLRVLQQPGGHAPRGPRADPHRGQGRRAPRGRQRGRAGLGGPGGLR